MQTRRASNNSTIAENIVLAGTPAVTIAALVAAALIVPRREAAAWSVYSRQTGLKAPQLEGRDATRLHRLNELSPRSSTDAVGSRIELPYFFAL